jgi:hypothetical protein
MADNARQGVSASLLEVRADPGEARTQSERVPYLAWGVFNQTRPSPISTRSPVSSVRRHESGAR